MRRLEARGVAYVTLVDAVREEDVPPPDGPDRTSRVLARGHTVKHDLRFATETIFHHVDRRTVESLVRDAQEGVLVLEDRADGPTVLALVP